MGKLLGSDARPPAGLRPLANAAIYRADVLRFLPSILESYWLANGAHTVQLGNLVSGNTGVLPSGVLGASLVVIYRIVAPGNPAIAPLGRW